MKSQRISVFINDRLRVSVTDACNLTCVYCTNEGQVHHQKTYLSLDWWRRFVAITQKENIYIRKLNITGGEPLLHPALDEILCEAVSIAEVVSLNTNGTCLTPSLIEKLAKIGIHNIKFGIDWFFGPATKPLLRPARIDTDRLWASVRTAVRLMPRSSLNVVVTNLNAARLGDIVDYLIAQHIDKVELLELINHDFRRTGASLGTTVTAAEIVATLRYKFDRIEYNRKLAKYICWTHSGLMVQIAEDFCFRRACGNLWTRIDANGCFLPCIKGADTYPVKFDVPLSSQVRDLNRLICNGYAGRLPRNSDGQLQPEGIHGAYQQPMLAELARLNISITDLDP